MGQSILLVEDEPQVRVFLDGMLKNAGYSVLAVGTGDSALDELRNAHFSLILCDLDLGAGPSGLEILRAMPACNAETPFIVLTGHGSTGRCREAFLLGATDFVEKPSSPNALLAALHRALGDKDAPDPPVSDDELDPVGAMHVRRALAIVDRRFSDPDLSVRDVATATGVSPEHLARVFRGRTGRTPLDHIHEVRVQAAEKLLAKANVSIYEVALDCGYRSTSDLDDWFRRLRDMTPTQFRAQFVAAKQIDQTVVSGLGQI